MFILKSKHKKIILELEKESKDLKNLLEKIIEKTGIPPAPTSKSVLTYNDGNGLIEWRDTGEIILPDKYPVYTKDIITNSKVIKQEANKVIKINKKGEVTEGLTKQKNDKGYKYVLIRE